MPRRVFFAGGFVDEKNVIARRSIAANFRNLGGAIRDERGPKRPGCAYFLRHSDFLGALGSLQGALRAASGARKEVHTQKQIKCCHDVSSTS